MSIASKPTENIHAEGCTISGLHKSYGDVEVLKGISLTVRTGEVVCVPGLEDPSALDALARGFHVRVFTDLIAGVAEAPSEAALAELARARR